MQLVFPVLDWVLPDLEVASFLSFLPLVQDVFSVPDGTVHHAFSGGFCLLRWHIQYVGRFLKVNGSFCRDTYTTNEHAKADNINNALKYAKLRECCRHLRWWQHSNSFVFTIDEGLIPQRKTAGDHTNPASLLLTRSFWEKHWAVS